MEWVEAKLKCKQWVGTLLIEYIAPLLAKQKQLVLTRNLAPPSHTVHFSELTVRPTESLVSLSGTITLLTTTFVAVFFMKRFFIYHHPCEETAVLELCLACRKTHVLLFPHLSLIHKCISPTGVRGNRPPRAEGCYFRVCGLMWENKSHRQRVFSTQEDFLAHSGKKRGKPWYSCPCRSQLYSWINWKKVHSLVNMKNMKAIVMVANSFHFVFQLPSALLWAAEFLTMHDGCKDKKR